MNSYGNSAPFLVPSGTTIGDLLIEYLVTTPVTATYLTTSGVALQTLSSIVAPTDQVWVRITGLPDLVVAGYPDGTLVVEDATSKALYLMQDIVVGTPADFQLLGQPGPYPATITITDSNLSGSIQGVVVSIWDQDLTTQIIPYLVSDQNGNVVVGLPVGIYSVLCFGKGVSFTNPYTLHITTGSNTLAIAAPQQHVTIPAANMVTVYGYLQLPDATPIVGAVVALKLATAATQVINGIGVGAYEYSVKTDSTGYFEVIVMAGLAVTFSIDQIGLSLNGTLPTDLVSVDLTWLMVNFIPYP